MKTHSLFDLIGLTILFSGFAIAQATLPNTVVQSEIHEQSETSIALHPTNHNIQLVTWNDFRSGPPPNGHPEPGYAASTDGGVTWVRNVLVLPSQQARGFDPSCAINRDGRYFYCYAIKNTATPQRWNIAVSRTTTPGTSDDWEDHIISEPITEYLVHDKPFMAIDNTGGQRDSFLYVTWSGALNGTAATDRIYFSRSSDGGGTWLTPKDISSTARAFPPGGTVTSEPVRMGQVTRPPR
jgi:hypothetical protein